MSVIRKASQTSLNQNGFTLVELIIGMIVLSIALSIVYSVLAPQTKQGLDPIFQVKAVALAKSLSNEILAKSFDENSDPAGNLERCNESLDCSLSAALGPDAGETRIDYNDVDDFNGFSATGQNIMSSAGFSSSVDGQNLYSGFSASVEVFYDSNLDGINDDDLDTNGVLDTGLISGNIKTIVIQITMPNNENLIVSSIKGNF